MSARLFLKAGASVLVPCNQMIHHHYRRRQIGVSMNGAADSFYTLSPGYANLCPEEDGDAGHAEVGRSWTP